MNLFDLFDLVEFGRFFFSRFGFCFVVGLALGGLIAILVQPLVLGLALGIPVAIAGLVIGILWSRH